MTKKHMQDWVGKNCRFAVINKTADRFEGMLKTAGIEKISIRNLFRVIAAAYGTPFMSPGARENFYKILVQKLLAKADLAEKMNPGGPGLTLFDAKQAWIDIAREATQRGHVLPSVEDSKDVQKMIDDALLTIEGARGRVETPAIRQINKDVEQYLGKGKMLAR